MVANLRQQPKREIILEDSTILEEERRTAASFDPRNGGIVAEIRPIDSLLSCFTSPKYDISTVSDALKNLDNPITETEFRSTIEKLSNDRRFKCYCLLYRNVIPMCSAFGVLGLLLLFYAILRGILFAFVYLILWCFIASAACFFALLWRRYMRVRVCECFRVVNRSLSAHNLIAGIWDYGIWPRRKVLIILMRYRIRDCIPTVERAFFARWAEQGHGRVDIESAERKDRSTQLLLRESNEYVAALAKGLTSLSSFPKDDGRPNHSQLAMCLCRFVVNRNFLVMPRQTLHNRISRIFISRSSIASAVHAF